MPAIKFYIWIALLVLGQYALAEDASSLRQRLAKPKLTSADWIEIFIEAEDNPKQFLQSLADLWNQTPTPSDGLLRARVGWMIGRFANYEEIPGFKVRATLRQTLELIEQQNLPISRSDLRYFIAYTELRAEDQEQQLEQIQNLITLAEQIENPDTRAFAYTQIIFESVNSGIKNPRVPHLIDEVVSLLPMDQSPVSPIYLGTLGDLSAVLATIGQVSQAEGIYKRLDATCDDQTMRVFCAIRAYNRATLLLKDEDSARTQEAIQLFETSLQLSLQVDDRVMEAKNQYGLSRALNQLGRHKDAVDYGQKAANFLQQHQMDDWAALALAQVARAYLAMKDPAQSALIGEKALRLCPPNIESIVTEIHLYLTRSYEALGKFDQAFKHLQLHMEGERRIRTDDAHKQYMKLRDESLSKQNELQAHQISLLKKFRAVSFLAAGLALILSLAMLISYRQSIVIRQSRQRMKEVLDNIDEGIAILGHDLKIQSGYSPFLHHLLGDSRSSLEHIPLLDLLPGDDSKWLHDKVIAQEALLACMGDSLISWDFNRDHLPHEVKVNNRILSLHWQPLLNNQQLIDRYLVAIRDLTAIKAMERQAQEQVDHVNQLQSALQEILKGNYSDIKSLMLSIDQGHEAMRTSLIMTSGNPSALRQLHTWKGIARTLGLKNLATSIHELESALKVAHEADAVTVAWETFEKSLTDYRYILNTLLVATESQSARSSTLYDYGTLYTADLTQRFREHACPMEGLMISDQVQNWKDDGLTRVHHILLHVLTNAADHGFIRPRMRHVQVQAARIQIVARIMDDKLTIEVTDNGAGIDWARLTAKAQALGITWDSRADLSRLLFQDGISTAENTSETSGRGVGLAAVKDLCEELSGHVTIGESPGGGTKVLIVLPAAVAMKDANTQIRVA